MKLIGLTGGAGSGKSTVAAMFRELGAEVIDADDASHAAYAPGTPGFAAVVAEFGPDYVRGGQIDRARLGELVFNDPDARRRLNAIVHPLVRQWMTERTAEAAERGAGVVIHDVPLLFENGLETIYADVICVYVPERLQVKRLIEGRGISPERARAMLASQMPIEEKRSRAQHVIDNSGPRETTREQVRKLWVELTSAR
ncbi:MAG TPA: dephospho-CoA kinase [Candidatus Udaeobacter sp.]|nr:dephospho-CoA kinase [Candidatus Udaeobacter sp.]